MLTLLLGAAELLDGDEGGVEVEGPQGVGQVRGVNGAGAHEVVDVEHQVGP